MVPVLNVLSNTQPKTDIFKLKKIFFDTFKIESNLIIFIKINPFNHQYLL